MATVPTLPETGWGSGNVDSLGIGFYNAGKLLDG